MEIRGINVSGSSTSFVNGDYLISDMLTEGNSREWKLTLDSRTMSIMSISITDDVGTTRIQWAIVDTTDPDNLVVYYV